MAQTSYPWGGTATGDATLAPYTDDAWSDIWRKLFLTDRTVQGVIYGYANALIVTHPSGTTIRVATGAALVDGKFYENTANVDNTVTVPVSGSNFYRIVLRKDFSAQTVRVAMLGPNVASPDAVTQTDGTTWEISLATIEVTSTSTYTVTDTREYVHFVTRVTTANIDDDAVDDTKVGSRVPQFYRRQGGSSTVWSTVGPTNYTPTSVRMQGGAQAVGGGNTSSYVGVAITFPVAFSYAPLVLVQAQGAYTPFVGAVTASSFTLYGYDGPSPLEYFWFAIGPE